MFNSPTFNNFTTSPILYVDNTLSYLAEDFNPSSYLSSSYYHLPASPLIFNESTDIYLDSFLSQNDVLQLISPPFNATTPLLSDDHSSEAVLKSTTTEMVDPNKAEETASGIVVEDENNNNKKKKKKKIMRSSSGSNNGLRVKRRSSKKDRHSKIKTAQGLRDRRMRLSLEVARSFFSLQDMLGYDKASRTVEWLLIQSKAAIEELLGSSNDNKHRLSGVTTANKCTMSSNSSDCEVESVIIEEEEEENNNNKGKRSSSTKEKRLKQVLQKRKRRTAKESREEARARARKRTLERKLMLSRVGHVFDKGNLTSCWGDFEMMEGSHNDSNSQISQKGSISINPVETGDHIVDSGFTTNWAAFGY